MMSLIQLSVIFIKCNIIYSLVKHTFFPMHRHHIDSKSQFIHRQNIWELGGEYQGDIILPRTIRKHSLWENAEIPIDFDNRYNQEQIYWIQKCLDIISGKTCIKLRLRTEKDKNYVHIYKSLHSCSTKVGKVGGIQVLNLMGNKLGEGCLSCGTILHEFLHVLGFMHEQGVHNRNKYIRVLWKNIEPGKEYHFARNKEGDDNNFDEKYDYKSIMHFSSYAFTKNGKKTIVSKNPNEHIGRNLELSKIDIAKMNKMYCGGRKTINGRWRP